MIYPLIGRRQLDTLRDYVGRLDFDQEKKRMDRPDFDVMESERPLLATYKLLIIYRFSQDEQKRQNDNPQSYTPNRGGPQSWTYRMCLSSLLTEGKEKTQAMLNSYYQADDKVQKTPMNQYTIGELIQSLPFILDRSGVKPLE